MPARRSAASKKRGAATRARAPPAVKKSRVESNLPAVVVGSYAMSVGMNNRSRTPGDVDVVCTPKKLAELEAAIADADPAAAREERHGGAKVLFTFKHCSRLPLEVELVPETGTNSEDEVALLSSLSLLQWAQSALDKGDTAWQEREIFPGFVAVCCPLHVLVHIKRSHLIYELQWQKHIRDYHCIRKHLSDHPTPTHPVVTELEDFTNRRRREIGARLGDKSTSKVHLDVPNEDFFKVHYLKELTHRAILETRLNQGATIYEHDELHALLAIEPNRPVYTRMKHDPSKAMLDKDLFDAADHVSKLNLVREEAMAIAAERIVIPALLNAPASTTVAEALFLVDDANAYAVGLQLTLTRLSKGWFRTFGLDHWPEVCECPWSSSGGMARKIIEDSRIIFGGKTIPWSADGAGEQYSAEKMDRWGNPQLVASPSKSVERNARLRALADAFSHAPVVPEFKIGDVVTHEKSNHVQEVSDEILWQARKEDPEQFSPRQVIEDWGNPRMPHGWYDASGSGIPDDYGRFVDVGEYQLEEEDEGLKEAIDAFRKTLTHYKNHPEDIDHKWKWSIAYAGRDEQHVFVDTPPTGIVNIVDKMYTEWLGFNKPENFRGPGYIHGTGISRMQDMYRTHTSWLQPPPSSVRDGSESQQDPTDVFMDILAVHDGSIRANLRAKVKDFRGATVLDNEKDKLVAIEITRPRDAAVICSFDVQAAVAKMASKVSEDHDGLVTMAREFVIKTLNTAQLRARQSLLWSPDMHMEFPQSIRNCALHLALCVNRACESRCSPAGIVPLSMWVSCIFPFAISSRTHSDATNAKPNIVFRMQKELVVVDIMTPAHPRGCTSMRVDSLVSEIETVYEVKPAPTYITSGWYSGSLRAQELCRLRSMPENSNGYASLIVGHPDEDLGIDKQYLLQRGSYHPQQNSKQVYYGLPQYILSPVLETLKAKSFEIAFDIIEHAPLQDEVDIAVSRRVLIKNEMLRLLQHTSCQPGQSQTSTLQKTPSNGATQESGPISLRGALAALAPAQGSPICPLGFELELPYGQRMSELSKEQIDALKTDAAEKANGYKDSITTNCETMVYEIDGENKVQLVVVQYEFCNTYKTDNDGDRHCEKWFSAFSEGFNTHNTTENACTLSFRQVGLGGSPGEEQVLFQFRDSKSRDSWDSSPRTYEVEFNMPTLCALYDQLHLTYASPIDLLDFLFLITKPATAYCMNMITVEEEVLGPRIDALVEKCVGIKASGLFAANPLLGLNLLQKRAATAHSWGQLYSPITILALEKYLSTVYGSESEAAVEPFNLHEWIFDDSKMSFEDWKRTTKRAKNEVISTDLKPKGEETNSSQNCVGIWEEAGVDEAASKSWSRPQYSRKTAIAKLEQTNSSAEETAAPDSKLGIHKLFAAAGIMLVEDDGKALTNHARGLLRVQAAAIIDRAWLLAAHRHGLLTVGEIQGADILFAKKIKAIAEHWLPPLHAWRQQDPPNTLPALVRAKLEEVAPDNRMLDHVTTAILVDVADSFFATVVRTTVALKQPGDCIRLQDVFLAMNMCFGDSDISSCGKAGTLAAYCTREAEECVDAHVGAEFSEPLGGPVVLKVHEDCFQSFSTILSACETAAKTSAWSPSQGNGEKAPLIQVRVKVLNCVQEESKCVLDDEQTFVVKVAPDHTVGQILAFVRDFMSGAVVGTTKVALSTPFVLSKAGLQRLCGHFFTGSLLVPVTSMNTTARTLFSTKEWLDGHVALVYQASVYKKRSSRVPSISVSTYNLMLEAALATHCEIGTGRAIFKSEQDQTAMAAAVGASVEYLVSELLELSTNAARDRRMPYINSLHVALAVGNDEELTKVFRNGGVLTVESPLFGGRGQHLPRRFGDVNDGGQAGPTFFPRSGSNLHVALLHGLHCSKGIQAISTDMLMAMSTVDQLDSVGWGAEPNDFVRLLRELSTERANVLRREIIADTHTRNFLSTHLFHVKWLNRTGMLDDIASSTLATNETRNALCSLSLAQLRTFLLTYPSAKRVRLTLHDEARWQFCGREVRLKIIDALQSAAPHCEIAFAQFVEHLTRARKEVGGDRFGLGQWRSLPTSNPPRAIVVEPICVTDDFKDGEMYTTLPKQMLTCGTELSYAPLNENLEEEDHQISFKGGASLVPDIDLSKLVGHDTTPPPDAIILATQDSVPMPSQPGGAFLWGNLKKGQLITLPDVGTSGTVSKGLCYSGMLFSNVAVLASDEDEDDLPKTRDADTRRQNRDADLSDVWESIGTTTATITLDYAPNVYKYAYADVREPGRTYLDEKGLWSLADRAGVLAMDASTIMGKLESIVHAFCAKLLTDAVEHIPFSDRWSRALEQTLPFQILGLRCSAEWPGHGACDDPEPIIPSVDLETAYEFYAGKLLDAYYYPGTDRSSECNSELYKTDFPAGQGSYKMAHRPFEPDLDSAFAQRLSELKWSGHVRPAVTSQTTVCRDYAVPSAIGVVLDKARFKQGLMSTWANIQGSEGKRLSHRVVALFQMNCEHLLVHMLKLAHEHAVSTGRTVGSSIIAKNPWSHAFVRDEQGQLNALRNKWCPDDAKSEEMPFWFVKGEDIDVAALTIDIPGVKPADAEAGQRGHVAAPLSSVHQSGLFLDPVTCSLLCSHLHGVQVSNEASVVVQEECEAYILDILHLAGARSQSEANVASLNRFISKSSEPIALTRSEEWAAAGVNLDLVVDRENPSVVCAALEEAIQKLVSHRCKEAQTTPSCTPILKMKCFQEAEETVKNCLKFRRPPSV